MALPRQDDWKGTIAWLKRLRPDVVFLVIAGIFGLAVLAVNPPFQAPDEFEHYFRALQLSEGTVVGHRNGIHSGGVLPLPAAAVASTEGIPFDYEKKMTRAMFRNKADPVFLDWSTAPRTFFHFPHTVIYPPISYVPQTIAIGVGKLFHLGPLLLLYAARLSMFVLYLILGWGALQRLPCYRWSCMLLLLAPMSIYLMGSAAPDAILIGSGFLLMGIAIQSVSGAHSIGTRSLLLVIALAALLGNAKMVYLPISFAAATLILPRLADRKRRIGFVGVVLVVSLVPAWIWARFIAEVYVPGRGDIPIDPAAQSRHVLAHPLEFLRLAGYSLHAQAGFIYKWFVGTLGWGDTPMPQWYYNVFGWGLAGCVLAESGGAKAIRWWHRAVMLAAALAATLAILLAQYVTWNSPGSRESMEGICGRYFLPIAPLVILSFPALGRLNFSPHCASLLGATLASMGAIVCLVAVVMRYYVA